MSKIALDEGVPEEIGIHLPGHDVESVRQLGLKGTKNGQLLAAIEAGRFMGAAMKVNWARRTGNCSLPLRPGGFVRLSAMTSGWNLKKRLSVVGTVFNQTPEGFRG